MDTEEKINYLDEPLLRYINRVSSKTPVPGGGSVVACVASLSSALVGMVLNYTIGKDRYAAYEKELKDIFTENETIIKKLSEYIERDSKIYQEIRRYTSKKDYISVEKYLKDSAELHLDICRTTLKIIEFADVLTEKGNKGLISDTGIAASLAISVFTSAKMSVLVNVMYIKEGRDFVERLLEEIRGIEKNVIIKGQKVCEKVIKQLEGNNG
ncbi:MAG: cyclodeaminase/cyclohydrolase family protein [Candidatus Omnitrophica bacterium]|nr:cyclodeaminase/cyclohydrolase family protein [Candidatus Omnitrophota bacterium]MCM8830423.1 cyclodeaminase/cyclohydrolase family protein [Candidatus Omnitrophota bacterium]